MTGGLNPTARDLHTRNLSRFAATVSRQFVDFRRQIATLKLVSGMIEHWEDDWRVNDADRYTMRRYDEFRAAAEYVATALASVPAVVRIALLASVASAPRVESTRKRRG
jgi:hypothetical protein